MTNDRVGVNGRRSRSRRAKASLWLVAALGVSGIASAETVHADGTRRSPSETEQPESTPPVAGDRDLVEAAGSPQAISLDSPLGEFTALTPSRLLDTRKGTGRNGVIGPIVAGAPIEVQITGRGGVATSGVAAVVMNVTVTQPSANSHLIVWPDGHDEPLTSSVNFVAGQTVPNLVTVAVGANGRVRLSNAFGSAHVIFDVVGFYADELGPAGGRFASLSPVRLLDTRRGSGGVGTRPLGPGQPLRFDVRGKGGIPEQGVRAVVLNVTVTQPTHASHLTVYPGDVSLPIASNLNYVPGLTVPNLVVVRVPANGIVEFRNEFGSVHLIADAVGYYHLDDSSHAGRFIPASPPERVFDSRRLTDGVWRANETWLIGDFPGFAGLRLGEAAAAVLNVTAVAPTAPSHLTVFPSDSCDLPTASNLNFGPGRNVANQVIVGLGPTEGCAGADEAETVAIYNFAGEVHVVVDLFGVFTSETTTIFDP